MTVIRPFVSQHSTVSPPTAITRLIRSCSSDDGSSPMKVKNCFTCLMTTGSGFFCSSGGSQPPGSLKTTTSPRCGSEPNQGVNLSTSTRSPILMVCSIEPDGMTNAWSRKVLSTSAISRATMTSSGTSRASERRRLRLTLRASLRRSIRLLPVSGGPVSGPPRVLGPSPGPSPGPLPWPAPLPAPSPWPARPPGSGARWCP